MMTMSDPNSMTADELETELRERDVALMFPTEDTAIHEIAVSEGKLTYYDASGTRGYDPDTSREILENISNADGALKFVPTEDVRAERDALTSGEWDSPTEWADGATAEDCAICGEYVVDGEPHPEGEVHSECDTHDGTETLPDGGQIPEVDDPAVEFSEDVTLKPHPNELKKAVNGDHVVGFHFKDYTVKFHVDGEPADGDHWNAEDDDGNLRWTYVDIPADVATRIVHAEDAEFRDRKNGVKLRVRGEVKE